MEIVEGSKSRRVEAASTWRRLFAFCLDGLILGALGGCLGLVAFDPLAALGDWGRVIGFAISVLYFGAMDSRLAGGQTLGKRILGIKVVSSAGTSLSVGASTLRATLFCVPYFLNGTSFNGGAFASWLMTFLVFGVGVSIAYLLLFNRRTRQSLHDLAVGAYVVSRDSAEAPDGLIRLSPVNIGAVGVILAVALILPYLLQRLVHTSPFAELASVQQALERDPDVRHASAVVGVSTVFGKDQGTTTHIFTSNIVLSKQVTDFDSEANKLVQIILEHDPAADREDMIAVFMRYGYDIGIASAWRTRKFELSPAEWRKRLSHRST